MTCNKYVKQEKDDARKDGKEGRAESRACIGRQREEERDEGGNKEGLETSAGRGRKGGWVRNQSRKISERRRN